MKKIIVVACVAAMVMGMAVAASAAVDNQWLVQLQAFQANGYQGTAGVTNFGTVSNGTNGYKSGEDTELLADNANQAEIICVDLPSIDPTKDPRWSQDRRSPLAVGQSHVWNLLLFVGPTYDADTQGDIVLKGWQPAKVGLTTCGLDPSEFNDLALYYNGEKIWDIKALDGANGSAAAPQFTTNFAPVVRADAYELQLVASTVPEPGSFVALLSGFVGLVGYGIRRRK